jgi:hypothetical protein
VFISSIAIVISLQAARLPYKKVINISTGNYLTVGESGLYVTVTNIGLCPVKVNMIGFLIDNKQFFNKFTIGDSQIVLHTSESTTHYLTIGDMQISIMQANINKTCSVYAFMRDSGGKIYKKHVCNVNNILSYKQ